MTARLERLFASDAASMTAFGSVATFALSMAPFSLCVAPAFAPAPILFQQ